MSEDRCPRCFSKISNFATGEEALWTNDPIKTPKGEAGDLYKGFTYITPTHIEELQQTRQQQEDQLGFIDPEATGYVEGTDIPKTTFTPVRIEGERVYFYKKHLRELRESTEKILEATGQTKETYFNYDEESTEYNIGDHRLDWHNIDLTQKFLDIKAVHIEDLRHYLLLAWVENFTRTSLGLLYNFYGYDYVPSTTYPLLKREGDYLAVRGAEGLFPYIDFNADLTSTNYPSPQGGKFTWSLVQWADPNRASGWSAPHQTDSWTNLVWTGIDTFVAPDIIYTMDCSACSIEFVTRESTKKDVRIYTDVTVDKTWHPTFGYGNMFGHTRQYLKYYFDENNLFKARTASKITFSISEFDKYLAWARQDYAYFKVQIPIYNESGGWLTNLEFDITGNGDWEIPLDLGTGYPEIFYLKTVTFLSHLYVYQHKGINPSSGHSWLKLRLVTPIRFQY